MDWKFCPHCGHSLMADWKFCAECGQQLGAVIQPTQPTVIWPPYYTYVPIPGTWTPMWPGYPWSVTCGDPLPVTSTTVTCGFTATDAQATSFYDAAIQCAGNSFALTSEQHAAMVADGNIVYTYTN